MKIRPTLNLPPGNHLAKFLERLASRINPDEVAIDAYQAQNSTATEEVATTGQSGDRQSFTREYIEEMRQAKGDRHITYLSTPRGRPEPSTDPNKPEVTSSQALRMAQCLRDNPKYGFVVSPPELCVRGWSEGDYRDHWAEVRRAFPEDIHVVMAPLWETHPGCVEDVKDACNLNLPLMEIAIEDLDRAGIRQRLSEATEELKERGFKATSLVDVLDGAVDEDYLSETATASFTSEAEMKDRSDYVRQVVLRTLAGRDDSDNDGARQAGKMTQSEFTRLYVEHALDLLDGRPMTYVSTPITGGDKKYDFLEMLGLKDKKDLTDQGQRDFVTKVIEGNTTRAFRISECLRDDPRYEIVMDPSEITIPEWSQADYSRHWDVVVQELAAKVVLSPDWELSKGCVLELQRALDKGIPIQEVRVSELTAEELLERLQGPKPVSPPVDWRLAG